MVMKTNSMFLSTPASLSVLDSTDTINAVLVGGYCVMHFMTAGFSRALPKHVTAYPYVQVSRLLHGMDSQ